MSGKLPPFEIDDPVEVTAVPEGTADKYGKVVEISGDKVRVLLRSSGNKHWHEARELKNLRAPKTFMIVSHENEPVACVIDAQAFYDRGSSKARLLASVRAELKLWFPDKQFEIQPSRFMLTTYGANSVLLGEAHVATYIAFEV